MKLEVIKMCEGKWVVRRKWLGGLFSTYLDSSDVIKHGSWTKGSISEGIFYREEAARKAMEIYKTIKSL